MQQIEFQAMGCQMMALTASGAPDAARALGDAPAWFAAWEQCLSRFRPESELSQVNRAGGRWVQVSDTLWDVLAVALRAAQASQGLVTPAVLDALEAIGYDRSFEVIETRFATVMLGSCAVADWRDIELDAARQAVRLPSSVRLDLGGVAKGWAADEAARRLAPFGAALVDAGGDIAAHGLTPGDAPFPVAVAGPWHADDYIETVELRNGGVATSGRDFRRWRFNGQMQHHIVDPRTALPAETDVLTATVVAPSATVAEIGAKVALILGSRAGLEWIESRPELAAVLALESGEIVCSDRFAACARREREEVI